MCQPPAKLSRGGCLSLQTLQQAAEKWVCNFSNPGLHCSQTPSGWVCKEALKSNSGLPLDLSVSFLPL